MCVHVLADKAGRSCEQWDVVRGNHYGRRAAVVPGRSCEQRDVVRDNRYGRREAVVPVRSSEQFWWCQKPDGWAPECPLARKDERSTEKSCELLIGGIPLWVTLDCSQEVSRVHPDILLFVTSNPRYDKPISLEVSTCFGTVNHVMIVCPELQEEFVIGTDFPWFRQLWRGETPVKPAIPLHKEESLKVPEVVVGDKPLTYGVNCVQDTEALPYKEKDPEIGENGLVFKDTVQTVRCRLKKPDGLTYKNVLQDRSMGSDKSHLCAKNDVVAEMLPNLFFSHTLKGESTRSVQESAMYDAVSELSAKEKAMCDSVSELSAKENAVCEPCAIKTTVCELHVECAAAVLGNSSRAPLEVMSSNDPYDVHAVCTVAKNSTDNQETVTLKVSEHSEQVTVTDLDLIAQASDKLKTTEVAKGDSVRDTESSPQRAYKKVNKKKLMSMEAELIHMQEKLAAAERDKRQAQQERDELADTREKMASDLEEVTKKLKAEHQIEKECLMKQMEDKHTEVLKLQDNVFGLTKDLDASKSQLAAWEQDVPQLFVMVSELRQRHLKELCARDLDHKANVQKLEASHLEKLGSLMSSFLTEIQKTREEQALAVRDLEKKKEKEVQCLRQELAATQLEKSQVVAELEAAHKEELSAVLAREEESAQKNIALKKVRELESQVSKLQEDLERERAARSKVEKQEQEVNLLKQNLEKSKQALESERNELANEVQALLQDKGDSEHKRKKVEAQLQELQVKISEGDRVKAETEKKLIETLGQMSDVILQAENYKQLIDQAEDKYIVMLQEKENLLVESNTRESALSTEVEALKVRVNQGEGQCEVLQRLEEELKMQVQKEMETSRVLKLELQKVQEEMVKEKTFREKEVKEMTEKLHKQELLIAELTSERQALSTELQRKSDLQLQLQEEIELLKCPAEVLLDQQVGFLKEEFRVEKQSVLQEQVEGLNRVGEEMLPDFLQKQEEHFKQMRGNGDKPRGAHREPLIHETGPAEVELTGLKKEKEILKVQACELQKKHDGQLQRISSVAEGEELIEVIATKDKSIQRAEGLTKTLQMKCGEDRIEYSQERQLLWSQVDSSRASCQELIELKGFEKDPLNVASIGVFPKEKGEIGRQGQDDKSVKNGLEWWDMLRKKSSSGKTSVCELGLKVSHNRSFDPGGSCDKLQEAPRLMAKSVCPHRVNQRGKVCGTVRESTPGFPGIPQVAHLFPNQLLRLLKLD